MQPEIIQPNREIFITDSEVLLKVHDSSQITKIKYVFTDEKEKMFVTFKGAKEESTYSYQNVPYEAFAQLVSAKSLGSLFSSLIKKDPQYVTAKLT